MSKSKPNLLHKQSVNGWTDENKNTLRTWKNSLSKASFIYQYTLDYKKLWFTRILIAILIITTITTVISSVSTILMTVDRQGYQIAALAINITIAILGGISAILAGIIKIFKLDEVITNITIYISKLDRIYSIVANHLVLPDNLKDSASTFIKSISKEYLELIQNSPDIENNLEAEAIQKHNEFMQNKDNNFKLAQKYDNDLLIDVI